MWPNKHIMRIPEGKQRDGNIEKVFEEIMIENFPNVMKTVKTRVQRISITKNEENYTMTHYKKISQNQ